jgi:hypothetical protein
MRYVFCAALFALTACMSSQQNVGPTSATLTSDGNIDIVDDCRGWHVSITLPYGWEVAQDEWTGSYELNTPSGGLIEYPRTSDTKSYTVANVSQTTLGLNTVTSASFNESSDVLYSISGHFNLQTQEGQNFGTFLSHGATSAEMDQLLTAFTYQSL